ncbi:MULTISPECIES: sensor histidine kinase KdpD [Bacteroides]|jgi:two-component system phosphate regulon sensor histidine kinase PhoR|uniref:sensor histidine kinase n=1 Tax=Bacteroides TaxID=816 RepID=UPI000E4F3208|nr:MULTISPECIES: HAMP domain-containing sensor histidine kinase [Bacteroides]RHL04251.1 sensor histidine kinase [Bacteroides sp. AF39-11AC]
MNRKHIILFTTLGLIAILSLQTIWLYNTFILVRNNIYGETNNILDEALTEAIADFSKLGVPEGTTISSGPINDSIPANTYFYDGLWKLGIEVPLCEVDFFAFKLLKRAGLESEFLSCLADPKSGKIYQKSKVQTIPVWGVIKSDIIPIRTDLSQGIQLVLLNPYWAIFERMGLLMIATAIMMIMVITCIIYQIKIIIRQDKIAKVREDFSYAMIHDMKTPLSSILACTSFLHSGKMESMQLKERYFCIIEDETGHLLNLTNKVLTLSKLENHKLEMSRTVFPLEPMIDDLIEKFSTKCTKPLHFTTNLQAKEVCADEEYLKEAISNLIDNAIKYSKESVEIDISSLSNATHTLIKVHDNGIGISEKDRKHIFEKFERASAFKRSRLGKVAGFGLGLNYVYQVMDAHEGSVTVNSVEKEFSEFVLYIPIKNEKL